jgi:hypothetical protein
MHALTRKDKNGAIIICICIDDAFMVGDHAAIEKTVAQLNIKVSLKYIKPLPEYVGCTSVKDSHKQKLWM